MSFIGYLLLVQAFLRHFVIVPIVIATMLNVLFESSRVSEIFCDAFMMLS